MLDDDSMNETLKELRADMQEIKRLLHDIKFEADMREINQALKRHNEKLEKEILETSTKSITQNIPPFFAGVLQSLAVIIGAVAITFVIIFLRRLFSN